MTKSSNSVCLTFDFDGMSVWIGSFKSNNPSMISSGEFGAVAACACSSCFATSGVPATFFVPGAHRLA